MNAADPIVLGLDAGCRSLREADRLAMRWADDLAAGASLLACTHFVGGRVAVSLRGDRQTAPWDRAIGDRAAELAAESGVAVGLVTSTGPQESTGPEVSAETGASAGSGASAERAAEAAGRTDGRAVLFAGADRLTGDVPMADVFATTAIDAVAVLGGERPDPDAVLRTRDHVRPEWRSGTLTLAVSPAGPGRYVPFEVPNPTPCCADHA